MKKWLKIALPIAGAVAAAAAAAAVYLVAPEKADEKKKAPFMGRNFAHRGLHTVDKSIPENTMSAFKAATESGYGIELDVHLTADDRLAVFHDDDLERLCCHDGRIEDMTYDELKHFRIAGSREGIPLLGEVLNMVDGRVPIILELKRGGRNEELCRRTYELLSIYKGDICVESFDPFILRWWKKNAPEVLRGQLSQRSEEFGENVPRYQAIAVGNVLTNFLCRPNFIAYGICDKKPFLVRLSEKLGAMKVAWTSKDWINEAGKDAVIFEFYRPRIRFK